MECLRRIQVGEQECNVVAEQHRAFHDRPQQHPRPRESGESSQYPREPGPRGAQISPDISGRAGVARTRIHRSDLERDAGGQVVVLCAPTPTHRVNLPAETWSWL
jgi:hypothetical protein